MINRIVKMSFHTNAETKFIELFNAYKGQIRNFPGCRALTLLKETSTSGVYFTYSLWESESHLESYRKSDLFKAVWSKTREGFNQKPQAWSTVLIDQVS